MISKASTSFYPLNLTTKTFLDKINLINQMNFLLNSLKILLILPTISKNPITNYLNRILGSNTKQKS